MKINLDVINVGNRYRKQMGDIEGLAASIADLGMLQPVVLDGQDRLVAGQRRLEAAKLLGWKEVPCVRVTGLDDASRMLKAERDENTCRKDLAPSEAVALGDRLEEIERPKAKERQAEGQKAGGRGRKKLGGKLPPSLGKTRAKVAAAVGLGARTYSKAKAVVASGQADLIEKMDQTGQVDGAHREVQRRERAKAKASQVAASPDQPVVHLTDGLAFDPGPVDLFLTDPPYSTEIKDIEAFSAKVVSLLRFVKPTGRGYICIGPYPRELRAYLNAPIPEGFTLEQVLVWTYRNTLGPAPKRLYKNNWQAILYFVGREAPGLDCAELNELFSVADISAPDGRHDGRLHRWQKPDALAERFIRHSTKAGQVVYDPFVGTGTFILQAALLGRVGVGCETDKQTLAVAAKRGCRRV